MKKYLYMSSAAVVIGTLRVKGLVTQHFQDVELTVKREMCELLRHERIPETQVLAP